MNLLLAAAIVIPAGLDLYVPVPDENPITAEKIEVGRRLFFDARLSRDGSVSCASCHSPERAFSDSKPTSTGVFGRKGRRNAPALVNRAYGTAFFWDGRVSTLEEQVVKPIEDPVEIDLTVAQASARVGMPLPVIANALATFVRSLLSGGAPFDRFIAGDRTALTAQQIAGLQLFRGKANCVSCHLGPNFTDERFHNTRIAWRNGAATDEGRLTITRKPSDRAAFKTPTLREVARTAPYMHDGSIATLREVIEYYNRGGNANPGLDPDLHPLHLSEGEKSELLAFLESATSGTTLDRGRGTEASAEQLSRAPSPP